jgi:hypothetical protein
MSDTIIYLRRGRLVWSAVGSLGFVAVSFFLFTQPRFRNDWFVKVVCVIAIVFFGAAFFFILSRLLKPRPAVILRGDGIVDESSGLAAGLVPWSEITSVHVATIHGQRLLCLALSYPDVVLSQQPAAKRSLMQANMGLVGAPVVIAMDSLTMPGDQLLAEIKRRIHQNHLGSTR